MANIFQQIGRYIGGFLTERSSLIFGTSRLETYADIKAETVIEKGFNSNTAVYSIVMTDADKFGSIPRYVYDSSVMEEKSMRKKKEKKAEPGILAGDLTDLINRPNEYESQDAFFAKVRAFYKITGEAFIWLNRGDLLTVDSNGELTQATDEQQLLMPVLEMYVLPPSKIIVRQDPENIFGVSDFILEVNGKRQRLGKSNVIQWKMTNLNFDEITGAHLRGWSPLVSGYKTLQQNNDATNAAVRMYQNGGAKGILTNATYNKLTPEQQSQIKDVIDAKINNTDVKNSVATLQGEWAYHDLGISSVDMQLLGGKELSWKELCFLLKVPYEFFDSHSPYAEKQLAQLGWITNAIMPATKQLDGELNRILPKAFGLDKKAFIACDYWDLPEMQQVRLSKAESLSKIWAITPNQILEELGYEKSTDPQMDEQWVPSNLTPLSSVGDAQLMDSITQQLSSYANTGGNTSGGMAKISANGRRA